MRSLSSRLKSQLVDLSIANDGNIALIFCFTLPVLIGVAGLGIDSAAVYNQQSRMQSVADSTALAVGKEMNLLLEDLDPLKQSGMDRAEALLGEVGLADRPHTVEITLDKEKATSRVEIAMETRTFLPPEVWGQNPIRRGGGGQCPWNGPALRPEPARKRQPRARAERARARYRSRLLHPVEFEGFRGPQRKKPEPANIFIGVHGWRLRGGSCSFRAPAGERLSGPGRSPGGAQRACGRRV